MSKKPCFLENFAIFKKSLGFDQFDMSNTNIARFTSTRGETVLSNKQSLTPGNSVKQCSAETDTDTLGSYLVT